MKELMKKAERTVKLLKKHGLKLSTAESCTGGLLSGAITSVPGASEVFEMGITSYSSRIKNEILGVKSETLEAYGAVSRQTAREMASRIRKISGADIGVSVTGVAGPGPSDGREAGTVYIALADNNAVTVERLNIVDADRETVRITACSALLSLIEKSIEERKK